MEEKQSVSDENKGEDDTESKSDGLWEDAKKSFRTIKFWVEIVALLGLGVYTYQTYRTNNLTQCALRQAKVQFDAAQKSGSDQFKLDQRPYVWSLSALTTFAQDHIEAAIHLANFGKSPAIDERSIGKVFVSGDLNQAGEWFSQFGNRHLTTQDASPTIVPPGVPPPIANPATPDDRILRGYIVTRVGSERLSNPEVISAESVNRGVIVALRVEYSDTSGDFHYSNMCWIRNLNGQKNPQGHSEGELTPCQKYNEIH